MALTAEEVKKIILAALGESKQEKAEVIQARNEALEARAIYQFTKKYTGTAAILRSDGSDGHGHALHGRPNNPVFYDCMSNWGLIAEYIKSNNLQLKQLEDIETAFLAIYPTGAFADDPHAGHVSKVVKVGEDGKVFTRMPNYERKTSTVSSRGQVNLPVLTPPPVHLDLTKKEILNMSPEKYKKLISGRDGEANKKEIDRIVQGR